MVPLKSFSEYNVNQCLKNVLSHFLMLLMIYVYHLLLYQTQWQTYNTCTLSLGFHHAVTYVIKGALTDISV